MSLCEEVIAQPAKVGACDNWGFEKAHLPASYIPSFVGKLAEPQIWYLLKM